MSNGGYENQKVQTEKSKKINKTSHKTARSVDKPTYNVRPKTFDYKYLCEDGDTAFFSIPENVTDDDLQGIIDTFKMIIERRFKKTLVSSEGK